MTTSVSSSAPRMPATLPFDVLADELGIVAGRIEREINLRVSREIEVLARLTAECELRLVRLEQAAGERIRELRDGVDGQDGAPGPEGPVGPTGAAGGAVVGPPGPPGPIGERGPPGETIIGPIGPLGETGPQGEAIRGERGSDGRPGDRGADGMPGEKGDRGAEGPPGKLGLCRAWADGVYYEGEVVTHRGTTWQVWKDTGQEPGHSQNWICLAARGDDGRTPAVRGTFVSDEAYGRLDIVALNGGSFIALKDNPGPCPGEGWQLLTSPGKSGGRGPQGERGERGLSGADGALGASIIAGAVNAREMKLILSRSDGEMVEVDLYDFALALRTA